MTTTQWRQVPVPNEAYAVLDYWFGAHSNLDDTEYLGQLNKKWFMGGSAVDREIEAQFSTLTATALAGGLQAWNISSAGQLAHIIVLDQFPRNLYRGTARAFAGDKPAFELARSLCSSEALLELHAIESTFAAMPYQHSEDLAVQQQSLIVFKKLRDVGPIELHSVLEKVLDSAHSHYDIVEKFGRFPHRNKAMGRTSSDAEIAYLEGDGPTFGQ